MPNMSPRHQPLGQSIGSDVPLLPLKPAPVMPPGLSLLCIRHRYRYMKSWQEGIDAGMSSLMARMWAESEIKDLVEKGELGGSVAGPLIPDDSGAELVLAPNPKHAPRKLRLKPRANRVIDGQLIDPAPILTQRPLDDARRNDSPPDADPSQLPLPIESMTCGICMGIAPCHFDWCEQASEMANAAMAPAPRVGPVTEVKPPEVKKPRFSFVKPTPEDPYVAWWRANGSKGTWQDYRQAMYERGEYD